MEVPRRAATERWGRCKVVRKTGEYAESMASAVIDRARRTARVVVGALDGAPVLLPGAALAALADRSADLQEIIRSELASSAFTPAQLELHSNVALRAIKHACA